MSTKTAHDKLKEWANWLTEPLGTEALCRRAIAEHEAVALKAAWFENENAGHVAQLEALHKERDQLKAERDRRVDEINKWQTAFETTLPSVAKAALDASERRGVEMRHHLFKVYNCCCDADEWDTIDADAIKSAIDSDCGKGYASREQVRVLKEKLERIVTCKSHSEMHDEIHELAKQALDLCKKLEEK